MTHKDLRELATKIRNLHLKRIISDEQYRRAIDELKAHR